MWNIIDKYLPPTQLPMGKKYNDETWEFTIRRDYLDHVSETGNYMLEEALAEQKKETERQAEQQAKAHMSAEGREGQDSVARNYIEQKHIQEKMNIVKYLVEAAFFLEVAVAYEELRPLKANLLKNLGTAYMHMVRSPKINPRDREALYKIPLVQTIRRPFQYEEEKLCGRGLWYDNSLKIEERIEDWKAWATNRFVLNWDLFLKHPSASQDSDYENIKYIFKTVTKKNM